MAARDPNSIPSFSVAHKIPDGMVAASNAAIQRALGGSSQSSSSKSSLASRGSSGSWTRRGHHIMAIFTEKEDEPEEITADHSAGKKTKKKKKNSKPKVVLKEGLKSLAVPTLVKAADTLSNARVKVHASMTTALISKWGDAARIWIDPDPGAIAFTSNMRGPDAFADVNGDDPIHEVIEPGEKLKAIIPNSRLLEPHTPTKVGVADRKGKDISAEANRGSLSILPKDLVPKQEQDVLPTPPAPVQPSEKTEFSVDVSIGGPTDGLDPVIQLCRPAHEPAAHQLLAEIKPPTLFACGSLCPRALSVIESEADIGGLKGTLAVTHATEPIARHELPPAKPLSWPQDEVSVPSALEAPAPTPTLAMVLGAVRALRNDTEEESRIRRAEVEEVKTLLTTLHEKVDALTLAISQMQM